MINHRNEKSKQHITDADMYDIGKSQIYADDGD